MNALAEVINIVRTNTKKIVLRQRFTDKIIKKYTNITLAIDDFLHEDGWLQHAAKKTQYHKKWNPNFDKRQKEQVIDITQF